MIKIGSGFPGERLIVIPQPMLELMADDPLTGDICIHSLGHIAHAEYHHIERREGCAENIFIYCSLGSGRVEVGGECFTLPANGHIILPAGVPHSYRADEDDPWSIYWIRFSGPKGDLFARAMNRPQTLLPSVYSRIDQRMELFESIYSMLCGDCTIDKMNYAGIALMHFLASFRYAELFGKSQPAASHAEGMAAAVTHFMNDNVEKRLTLKQIAEYAGLSESYFHRKFVAETGYSPIDYFIHIKVNKAAIYLLKTSMSISQIAAKLGFSSPNYFSRTFSGILGISPSEFRKQDFRL